MKDYKLLRIWEVIYPIGIYFVVTNVVMFVLNLMHTMTNENYMIYQIIATVIAFPFVYAFYRKEDGGKMANLPRTILFAAAAGLFGVVLNNLIGYTGLKETSQSYQEVSAAFYGSSLALEILGTCIIIPFLEELLYRGIVYQRLNPFLGVKAASRAASSSSEIFSSRRLFGISMEIMSPSRTMPMGPPEAASGETWPMQAPRVAPENRPSVMSATELPRPMPMMAEVGFSISRIPGPPLGPS